MAVPSSGQLRLRGDIALEVDGSATGINVSLRTLSASAGFSTPDNMSEFYGYTSASAPSVTTNSLTNIGETSMTLNGNVTSDGGATITERGFYFGTNSSSPTNNTKYTVGGTTGSYSLNRTGLSAGTTYYCWSFATNSVGTTYGSRTQANTIAAYNPTWKQQTTASIGAATLVPCGYGNDNVYLTCYLYYLNPNTSSYVKYAQYNYSNTGGQSFSFNVGNGMTNYAGRPDNNFARYTTNLFRMVPSIPGVGLENPNSQTYHRLAAGNVSSISLSSNRSSILDGSDSNKVTATYYVNSGCPSNSTNNAYFYVG